MAFLLLSSLAWLSAMGVIVWIIVHATLYNAPETIPLIGTMLTSDHPLEWSMPVAILAVVAWGLLEIAFKAVLVLRHYAALPSFEQRVRDGFAIDPMSDRIQLSRLVSKRADIITRERGKQTSRIDEVLPAMASIDANSIMNSYTSLNVYAWMLPVLGFIGTASGLASAISGFQVSLQNTTDIDALLTNLSQSVIPGLSSAFNITMLALGGALIVYLCAASLRNLEIHALNRLDQLTLEFLGQTNSEAERHNETQIAVLEEQKALMTDINAKIVTVTQTHAHVNAAAKSLDEASSTFKEAVKGVQYSFETLSGDLTQVSNGLRATLESPLQLTLSRNNSRTQREEAESRSDNHE